MNVLDENIRLWDQERRLRAFLLPDYTTNLPQRDHVDLPGEPVFFTVGMPIPVSCPDARLLAQPKTGVIRPAI